MNVKQKALAWWESLPLYQANDLERKHGYFGHDIGITESEVYGIWTDEGRPEPIPEPEPEPIPEPPKKPTTPRYCWKNND